MHSRAFEKLVKEEATRASGILTNQIADWTRTYGTEKPTQWVNEATAEQLRRYEHELAVLRSSRSLRYTKPIRDAASAARRIPVAAGTARLGLRAFRAIRNLSRCIAGHP